MSDKVIRTVWRAGAKGSSELRGAWGTRSSHEAEAGTWEKGSGTLGKRRPDSAKGARPRRGVTVPGGRGGHGDSAGCEAGRVWDFRTR